MTLLVILKTHERAEAAPDRNSALTNKMSACQPFAAKKLLQSPSRSHREHRRRTPPVCATAEIVSVDLLAIMSSVEGTQSSISASPYVRIHTQA